MKIEEQVCSFELAKKLKELGIEQKSLWYWCPCPTSSNPKYYYIFINSINHKRHFHWDDLIEVIPDTVGQFTGSYDKQNKRKVFEGDKYEFNSHKFTVEFIKDTFIFESVSKGRLSLDYLDTYNIKFLGIFEKDLEDGI